VGYGAFSWLKVQMAKVAPAPPELPHPPIQQTPELPLEPESGSNSTSPASREDYKRLWKQLYTAMDSSMSLEEFRTLLDSPEFQVQVNGVPRLHNLMRFRPEGPGGCTLLHVAFSEIHHRQSPILKQMWKGWGKRRLLTEEKIDEILKPNRGGQLAWTMRCGPQGETPLHTAVGEFVYYKFIDWIVSWRGGSKALFIENEYGLTPLKLAQRSLQGSVERILKEAEERARITESAPEPLQEQTDTPVRTTFDPVPHQQVKKEEGGVRKRTYRKKGKGKTKRRSRR
jgi:hypothetical protein